MTAEDVTKELGVSKGHAYKLIRELNGELKKSWLSCDSRESAKGILGNKVLWLQSTEQTARGG